MISAPQHVSPPPITVQSILDKIARMGERYAPGNASKPGHLYNPIPFPEFAHVPYQRGAADERFFLMRHSLPRPFDTQDKRLLDIGCHTGYNCFRFREMGFACTGLELDPLTAEIAQDVNALKQCGITFLQGEANVETLAPLGRFDLTLFLSTFQWVVLAQGFEKAKEILAFVQSRCDAMLFETSMGNEGKMKLPQLPNREAVAAMLEAPGIHRHVECLAPMAAPGSEQAPPRYVFRTATRGPSYQQPVHTLAPEAMRGILNEMQRTKPFYHKRNTHFDSAVYQGEIGSGIRCAFKIVKALTPEAGLMLTREHVFLRCLEADVFAAYLAHGLMEGVYLLILRWHEGRPLHEAWEDMAAQCRNDATLRASLLADLDVMEDGLRRAGIVHRDVWEKNLLFDGKRLRLIDFGWARWADETNAPIPEGLRQPDDGAAFTQLREKISRL